MNSVRNHRRRTNSMQGLVAIAILALSSCPNNHVVESLAFLDSKSSSTFTNTNTCSSNSDSLQQIPLATSHTTHHSTPSSSSSLLTMKVSSSSKRNRASKSSHLIERNNQRLQTAGRPGTKKFMDPNKVFIGNLPYDAVEDDVILLFSKHWNIPVTAVEDRIESVKIIRDWKSGQSKGYGFIQFYEPMVATSAMESVNKGRGSNGLRIKGRLIRLDQGKRRESEEENEKNKKKKKKDKKKLEMSDLDEEGMVIHSALEDIEGSSGAVASIESTGEGIDEDEDDDDNGLGMSEDDMITFMEKGGLRGVMPLSAEDAGFLGIEGLYDDDDDEGYDDPAEHFEQYYNENGYDDGDFEETDADQSDDEDGEDGEEIVYDGVFEELYNPNEYEGLSEEEEASMEKMNREQRRAAEKKRKKRKLPFKGFGSRD